MIDPETVLTIGTSILGGGGVAAAATKLILDRQKQKNDQKLAEDKQPVDQYAALVEQQARLASAQDQRFRDQAETQEKRFSVIEGKLEKCHSEHIESIEKHAVVMENVGILRGKLEAQTDSITHLRELTKEQIVQSSVIAGAAANAAIMLAKETKMVSDAAMAETRLTLDSIKASSESNRPSDSGPKLQSVIDKDHPLPVVVIPDADKNVI